MQKWRNWQTRTVQVRVVVIPWGFDSLLLQDLNRSLETGSCFFVVGYIENAPVTCYLIYINDFFCAGTGSCCIQMRSQGKFRCWSCNEWNSNEFKNCMFSRNLSVPDFVRRFFVSCAQISEAYGDEIRVRLAKNRPQRQMQERLREDIWCIGGMKNGFL